MDTDTGMVRVLKMTVAVDAGTIINPQAVEGQLEGGLDQGVGYAFREEYIHGETALERHWNGIGTALGWYGIGRHWV